MNLQAHSGLTSQDAGSKDARISLTQMGPDGMLRKSRVASAGGRPNNLNAPPRGGDITYMYRNTLASRIQLGDPDFIKLQIHNELMRQAKFFSQVRKQHQEGSHSEPGKDLARFSIEYCQLEEGRWSAQVVELPGVVAYASEREIAGIRARELTLEALLKQVRCGEKLPSLFEDRGAARIDFSKDFEVILSRIHSLKAVFLKRDGEKLRYLAAYPLEAPEAAQAAAEAWITFLDANPAAEDVVDLDLMVWSELRIKDYVARGFHQVS